MDFDWNLIFKEYNNIIDSSKKLQYLLNIAEPEINNLSVSFNSSKEEVEELAKELLHKNMRCINNATSLRRYFIDVLEVCEYQLEKKYKSNEKSKTNNGLFISSLEEKYINSLRGKIDLNKHLGKLSDKERFFIIHWLSLDGEMPWDKKNLQGALGLSDKEFNELKYSAIHNLLMDINPIQYFKILKKKSRTINFDCFGSYKKPKCFHDGENFICLKVEECKAYVRNKRGKCTCVYKSFCPQIRQAIFMKYKVDSVDNTDCQFYIEFKKDPNRLNEIKKHLEGE